MVNRTIGKLRCLVNWFVMQRCLLPLGQSFCDEVNEKLEILKGPIISQFGIIPGEFKVRFKELKDSEVLIGQAAADAFDELRALIEKAQQVHESH